MILNKIQAKNINLKVNSITFLWNDLRKVTKRKFSWNKANFKISNLEKVFLYKDTVTIELRIRNSYIIKRLGYFEKIDILDS